MVKAKDLRDQSEEELEATYQDLSKELWELRNELKIQKKMEKPHQMAETKRDIARVLTVLNEKKKARVGA